MSCFAWRRYVIRGDIIGNISWDGRVIRHCTSLSQPDGPGGGRVGDGRRKPFENHLYGTFTAAKERVVQAGRLSCAAALLMKKPPSFDSGEDSEEEELEGSSDYGAASSVFKKKTRRGKRKKRRRKRSDKRDDGLVGSVGEAASIICTAPIGYRAPKLGLAPVLGVEVTSNSTAVVATAAVVVASQQVALGLQCTQIPQRNALQAGILDAPMDINEYRIPKRRRS